MQAADIIARKRDGFELDAGELDRMVLGYTEGGIPDYQMAAFLMAVYLRGMTPEEIALYTRALVKSGETICWDGLADMVVDKHSSGGVGDKTTLVVAPLAASAGLYVAKMSGKGLGHTGGTIDKLESIPGFSSELSLYGLKKQVSKIGLALISQTEELTPADKLIYTLRDVTATVGSIPLIAGSIMSKKIAGGARGLALDVKVGTGAFTRDPAEAASLAGTMVKLGSDTGIKTVAIVSNMNQPLGRSIGNALEVAEALETLKGNGPADLKELSLLLGGCLLYSAGKTASPGEGVLRLTDLLRKGLALEKFEEMVEAQGAKPGWMSEFNPRSRWIEPVKAEKKGFIKRLDAFHLGRAAMVLGAGRFIKGDLIDPAAGIIIHAGPGDYVEKGEPVASLCANLYSKLENGAAEIVRGIEISDEPVSSPPLVLDRIGMDT